MIYKKSYSIPSKDQKERLEKYGYIVLEGRGYSEYLRPYRARTIKEAEKIWLECRRAFIANFGEQAKHTHDCFIAKVGRTYIVLSTQWAK